MFYRPKKKSFPKIAMVLSVTSRVLARDVDADEFPNAGVTAQSKKGMVASVSRPASEVGRTILAEGGNAVDAAIAVAFALAVTWPEAGNIGGGGFMLIHPGHGQPVVMIDYREMAPASATPEMFAQGDDSQYRLVGVPGTVRGLKLAHEKYGRLPWSSLVLPAVKLAKEGFEMNQELADSLNPVIATSRDNSELLRVFGNEQGQHPWRAGDRFVQKDLAETLSIIAHDGADAFYQGVLADRLAAEMQRGGGLITRADLAVYQAKVRKPVHGTFRGYEIYSSSPPSSGGTALVQMLNMVEAFDLRQGERWSARTIHHMIESMRRAYCDRARHLGDPDFSTVPDHLTSKDYARKLAQSISDSKASRSAAIGSDVLTKEESPNTTHFSVIDGDGMAVSNTYTLEDSFGSRIVVRGAGYILNNEMGDFNQKPGVTDSRGLIGTKANLAQPGKRMLSSMTPVIVTKDDQPVLITGSPGGRTIINTAFCILVNVLEYEMPPREAIDAPRLHHAWMPDTINMEAALLSDHEKTVTQLRNMGHIINDKPVRQGDAHSIFISKETGLRTGVADKRRDGWAAGE